VSPRSFTSPVLAVVAALLVSTLGGQALYAQNVSLAIDRPEITIEEQAELAATIDGASSAAPRLPVPDGVEVRYRGERSQISIVNGRFSTEVTYRWTLLPKATGEFAIGPAEIEIGGEVRRSNTVHLRVVEASAEPRGARQVFVTASVSDVRPFVGEQLLYVWRFYRRARITDPRLESLDLGGFLVEDLGGASGSAAPNGGVRTFRATYDGMEYEVSELRKALFAQRPGTIAIPPSHLRVQLVLPSRRGSTPLDGRLSSPFDELFGQLRTQTQILSTDPIEVEVRALPRAPAGFSGLVGNFTVDSKVSATAVAAGESLTHTVRVSGAGNLHLMGDLPLDELDGFKVYRDQPAVTIDRSGARLRGTKTFTRALVPLAAGALEVPEVALVYFDPARESYVTATAPALALDVAPGSGVEDLRLTESMSSGAGKVAVRILADDVLPIHRGLEAAQPRPWSGAIPILLVLPPVAYAGLLAARRRADRQRTDVGLHRRRVALRRALAAIGRGGELEAREASGVLRRYVGDRIGAEGGALTARECADRLAARGAADDLVRRVGDFLARLDAADYGGGGATRVPAVELRTLLDRIEREVRERGR